MIPSLGDRAAKTGVAGIAVATIPVGISGVGNEP